MGLLILDKVFIALLICCAILFSAAIGFCVYHVAVSIFEIAEVLTSEEFTSMNAINGGS